MAVFDEASSAYEQLKIDWKAGKLDACKYGLNQLKVLLTKLTFLPGKGADASEKELVLARSVLELGARWAIAAQDGAAFERYFSQLKVYYFDYSHLAPSAEMFEILGLNLMRLLSESRIAEFHTELERISTNMEWLDNVYIKHAIQLEQYLMEGRYHQVHLVQKASPSEQFSVFDDILLDTIREEIASCLEQSHESLTVKDASKLLFNPDKAALQELMERRQWVVEGDRVHMPAKEHGQASVQSDVVLHRSLQYATELEKIV